ncbi:MAG: hypothetical protein PHP79_03025 [Clostridia bacterium]|nr:hypothetical protein [Clostridia bacterium]
MKKTLVYILVLILILGLSGCGSKTNDSSQGSTDSGKATQNSVAPDGTTPDNIAAGPSNAAQKDPLPDNTIPKDAPPPQQSDIAYIPSYDKMELLSISHPDMNQMITSKYLIKNQTLEKALNKYAQILKKDGWTVNLSYTTEKIPYGLVAEKDKHTIVFLLNQSGNDVSCIIASK